MARKQQFTMQQVIDAVEKYQTIAAAAVSLKVSRQTIDNYAKRYPKIRKAIKAAREEMVDYGENKLREAVLKGEAWAVCFLLKTQGRKRGYVERSEHEISGKGGGAIEVKAFNFGAAIAGVAPRPMEDSESSGNAEGCNDG